MDKKKVFKGVGAAIVGAAAIGGTVAGINAIKKKNAKKRAEKLTDAYIENAVNMYNGEADAEKEKVKRGK